MEIIIVGSAGPGETSTLKKIVETLCNDINIIEEEPFMISNRRFMGEEMEYRRNRTMDTFDIDALLRDPKPLKVKTRVKKDSLYKGNTNKLGRKR